MKLMHASPWVAAATALTMAACGGGGDSAPAAPPGPAAPSGVGIGGTAATGAAIVGGAVSVTCASGSGQATTAANGSYSVSITSGVAPCLVQVTSGASSFYSMLPAGSANPSTVNITPLTTLMTAQVLGAAPAGVVFGDVQARITAANIATARTDLSAGLSGRVDLTGIDPIATAFVVGDATDQKLDQLQATLTAARVTLPELSAALIANAGAPYAIRTFVSPGAAGCPGLRSSQAAALSPFGFETFTVDTVNLTTTSSGGAVNTLTDNGDCNFTSQGGAGTAASTVLVSPSSVTVNRFATGVGGQFSMAFGFPLQTVPVADLAGTWNYVGYARDPSVGGSVLTPEHGTLTFNAAGANTAVTGCTGLNTCASAAGDFTLTPNAQGGFNIGDSSGVSPTSRAFAYRAPSGTMMLFFSATDADNTGFYVATRQVRLTVPDVGTATPFSQFTINSSGSAGAITTNVSTVTAVDASGGGSFTRTLLDGHTEPVLLNNPRDGMRHRMAGSTPGSNGTPVAFNAVVQMQPPGVGLTATVSSDPAQNFFNAAVFAPTP